MGKRKTVKTPYDEDFADREKWEMWYEKLDQWAIYAIYFWAGFTLALLIKLMGN